MSLRHGCNAYCAPPEHCELVYTDETAAPGHIAQAYGYHHGLIVTRVDPAREAGPLSAVPLRQRDQLSGPVARDERRWLVWWR